VVDDLFGPAGLEGHVERVEDDPGPEVAGEGPAHDLARPCIEHDRQEQETRHGWDEEPAPAKAGVISATQSWFGAATKKLRRTRSDAGLSAGLDRVVRMLLLRLTPVI
jgi:hypothetical protein